nr:MAG TPA: Protein of unknown function (DUF2633) [Crassvirales sp.]
MLLTINLESYVEAVNSSPRAFYPQPFLILVGRLLYFISKSFLS